MSYDYSVEPFADMEAFFMTFLMVMLSFLMVSLVIALVLYIFGSIGLYTIAKRRGIHSPWLAWLPIGNVWIQGCIADHYQARVYEKNTCYRFILLVLTLVNMVFSGAAIGQFMGDWMDFAMSMEYMSEAELQNAAMGLMAGASGSALSGIVSLALTILQFVVLYKLFNSCNPDNSTLFLVLSIFFGFLRPFFIFADRKKDLGMPAPKAEPQPCQMPQPPQEPWENA